jgi:hypothetical protein
MKRIFVLTFIIILISFSCFAQIKESEQGVAVPKGWKQVKACDFTFIVPKKLRDAKPKSLDSCIAGFSSKEIGILIDSGMYNGAVKQNEMMLGFKEEYITVD